MKRILEIINLPSSAKNFIGDQFAYFHEHGGHEMHLICSPGAGIDEYCRENHVKYYPVNIERVPSPWRDLKTLFIIFNYIRRNRIDMVICHQEKSRLLGTVAAWLLRVPVRVIYAHGVLLDTMQGAKRAFFLAEGKMVSSMAHKIVCVSPSVANRRAEIGMDNPQKQVVIGHGTCNGIDVKAKFNPSLISDEKRRSIRQELGLSDDDFVVGFCGRLVRDKGISELTKAIEILARRHPERSIKLLVIGGFEKRDAVPIETRDFLQSSPLVKFTGRVPFEEVQQYYTPMNVLVLPSYREGFGLATAEAAAMGVPAIVSRSTGCIDSIVENQTGVFADIDPTDIADKIELFFDVDFAQRLGRQAKEHVMQCYDHDDVLRNTLDFINGLITNIE